MNKVLAIGWFILGVGLANAVLSFADSFLVGGMLEGIGAAPGTTRGNGSEASA